MIGFTLTDEQREFRDMAHKFAEKTLVAAEAGTFKARIPIKPVPLVIVGAAEETRPTGAAMEDHEGYGKAVVR